MKRFTCLILSILMMFCMCACGGPSTVTVTATAEGTGETPKLSFVAEFYDNHGDMWLSTEGTSFNISPNKVKEYTYSSEGYWESTYVMSSVMSIDIDGRDIESCGSTVLFYDTRLEKLDIEIPTEVVLSEGEDMTITTPADRNYSEAWELGRWWRTKKVNNNNIDSRIVIIQSQDGDPICMFSGDNVYWDISVNLPKTTELCIDGKMIYIHRANFAIVDTSIFE